jgi:hypothetical protein
MTVKPGYNFAKIQRISVHPFEGPGGPAVTDEFVRQLVGTSLEVTDQKHSGDVILTGSVTDYKPTTKLMVFLGNTSVLTPGGQAVVVSNPVVSVGGSQVTPEGPALGLPNTQVVSVSATVGVIARLVDSSTGNIVWSDTYTYEGLDTTSALDAVIGSLLKSLGHFVPRAVPKNS